MARFNHTDRTLETLKVFIFNQTGMWAQRPEGCLHGRTPFPEGRSQDWLWFVPNRHSPVSVTVTGELIFWRYSVFSKQRCEPSFMEI